MTAATPGGDNILLTVVTLLLGSTLLAGLFTTALGNARTVAAARRDRYAQVVRVLVAWAEYPYRIRRRTNDEPQTLAALAERGHTLQEQMAESRAWVAGESSALSKVLDGCLADVTQLVGPACSDAWRQPPINTPADMVLGSFGPRGLPEIISRMERAVAYRFGIRRLMWHGWAVRRLRTSGCLSVSQPPVSSSREARPGAETLT
jgi:hypothetical protein